ncbi:hypothetical protein HEK616_68140 [Streptomyces nigrescens]|uniref:Uncharacterized protein n=1 Tax=Streptomyces nigrescens TaxID=1920 RepID=A0ABN6R4G2_STRNI|nr:hypothetical protein HEK616_68140 [Streptomyces nigrescens]
MGPYANAPTAANHWPRPGWCSVGEGRREGVSVGHCGGARRVMRGGAGLTKQGSLNGVPIPISFRADIHG